jgi:copper(I)-binding protein
MLAPIVLAATISITDAWSRPAIGTGVVYARIANAAGSADTLDRATSAVAKSVEMHRSMESPMKMTGMATQSVSSMMPISRLPIPSHGTAAFAPGGNHLMLVGLRRDLHQNDRFDVRLHFVHAGWRTATVVVRPI